MVVELKREALREVAVLVEGDAVEPAERRGGRGLGVGRASAASVVVVVVADADEQVAVAALHAAEAGRRRDAAPAGVPKSVKTEKIWLP